MHWEIYMYFERKINAVTFTSSIFLRYIACGKQNMSGDQTEDLKNKTTRLEIQIKTKWNNP